MYIHVTLPPDGGDDRRETKRRAREVVVRALLSCKVDHDDAEWFASVVVEELEKEGILPLPTREG